MSTNKLIKEIEKAAKNEIKKKGIEIECPNCKKTIKVKIAKTIQCPYCKSKIKANF